MGLSSSSSAEETVDGALAWLKGACRAPAFAWIHIWDPHMPYAPPAPWDHAYYTGDPREMVCLVIDRDTVAAEIRYEDPERIYPHIYGPLNKDAVIEVRAVRREPDGTFISIGEIISE